MKKIQLPPDDQPTIPTYVDQALQLQLEEAVSHHFFLNCAPDIRSLLEQCQWSMATNLEVPVLTVLCPDSETYWDLVGKIEIISQCLANVTRASRIEVIPGDKKNLYFDVTIGA
jgi:hypothetical protein